MGGEPTLHPKFKEICELLQKKVPLEKCAFFTSGYGWGEYSDIIKKTFKFGIFYNDHKDIGQSHQPILISINEVVGDKEVMHQLIDKCWVQERWSAAMNPKGGFFCEIAAAHDFLFNGPGGYPIEKGWWRKSVVDFQDQVKRYCVNCGGALPLPKHYLSQKYDDISPEILDRLKKIQSPKVLRQEFKIFDVKITEKEIKDNTKNWRPWNFFGRRERRKADLKMNELFLLRGFMRARRYYNFLKYKILRLFKPKSG